MILAVASFGCRSSDPLPDVVLIGFDTLRQDHVGVAGGEATSLTPNIDRILDGSLVFDRHQSCASWTYASMICLLSGASTLDVGFDPQVGQSFSREALDPTTPLLPNWLGDAGYTSVLVSANQVISEGTGLAGGYDEFALFESAPADKVVEALLGRIPARGPRLLHAHFMDPHLPYDAPDRYVDHIDANPYIDLSTTAGVQQLERDLDTMPTDTRDALLREVQARYRAEVGYLDDAVGRLWEELDAYGLLDNAVVVLYSDHGEQIADHSHVIGHGHSMYREEQRAIAAFRGPGVPVGRMQVTTGHADVAPTLLQFLGLHTPPGTTGTALPTEDAPRLGHISCADERHCLPLHLIVTEDWRMHYTWEGKSRLFEASDIGEQVDRYDEEPEVAEELWGVLMPEIERFADYHGLEVPDDVGP